MLYTKILIVLSLFVTSSFVSAQKLTGKISKEICECLEKYENLQTEQEVSQAMESCIMKSSIKHLDAIKKDLGIDMTEGEVAGRQFGEVIAYELVKKCGVFLKYIMMLSTDDQPTTDSNAVYEESTVINPDLVPFERYSIDTMHASPNSCSELHNAKFTYESENNKLDYFVLQGKTCTEYHNHNQYVSKYTIKWTSECEYESTFVESNNPEITNLLSKGDKIRYQIVGIYGDTVYLNLDFKGFSKIFVMKVAPK